MQRLPRAFYGRETSLIAQELLGKLLLTRRAAGSTAGGLWKWEAHLGPHDCAAHSARGGATRRMKVMFGSPVHAYVYFIYGMHHWMNVVTEGEGRRAAVLLRALEPVKNLVGRTCGPRLLCRAKAIDKRLKETLI